MKNKETKNNQRMNDDVETMRSDDVYQMRNDAVDSRYDRVEQMNDIYHHIDEDDHIQRTQNCDVQRKRSNHDEWMRSENNNHVGPLKIDDSEIRNDHGDS